MKWRDKLITEAKNLEQYLLWVKPPDRKAYHIMHKSLSAFDQIGDLFTEEGVNLAVVDPNWEKRKLQLDTTFQQELAKIRGKRQEAFDYSESRQIIVDQLYQIIEGKSSGFNAGKLLVVADYKNPVNIQREILHIIQRRLLKDSIFFDAIGAMYLNAREKNSFVNKNAQQSLEVYFAHTATYFTTPGIMNNRRNKLQKKDPAFYQFIERVLSGDKELYKEKYHHLLKVSF